MSCAVPSVLFCCLLLVAPHFVGSSYHTSYARGGHHIVLHSPEGTSPTTFCSDDTTSGDDGGITAPLRVYHRLSPCSPHSGSAGQSKPSGTDVLQRDALGLSSLLAVESDSLSDVVTVPTTGSPYVNYPSAVEYHVDVGFGTPLQRLTVGFDMLTFGLSLLACKPCSGGAPCDKSFDPSKSTSLAQIPCNSLDCPLTRSCSGKPNCVSSMTRNDSVWSNTTVVTDKLSLSGSTGMDNFRFACLEMGPRSVPGPSTAPHTASSTSARTATRWHHWHRGRLCPPTRWAFSYCLPSLLTTHGFLSIAAPRPELSNRRVSYTALHTNPAHPNQYFVQLTGITAGRKNIPVPPSGFTNDTLVALCTTFNYLRPDIYIVLHDEFVAEMSKHNHLHHRVTPVGVLDMCYNFTVLPSFLFPSIMFEFDGGGYMYLEDQQMLYLQKPHDVFSVACPAFAAAPTTAPGTVAPVAIIGTLAQAKTEMAYDLRQGRVGFVRDIC